IAELCFGRKRVTIQPFEKVTAIGTDHLELRRVEVRVKESGRDQRAAAEVDDVAVRVRVPRADARDPRSIDRQVSVVIEKVGLCRFAAEWVGSRREYPRPEQLHSPIV